MIRSKALLFSILFLGAVSLLLFRDPFLSGNMLFGSDTILHEYPHRTRSYGILREGLIPLWNPYMFCGLPLHASMQDGLFYPPNLLFAALPVKDAINLKTWLHMWLGGIGMLLLLRALGGTWRGGLLAGLIHMLSTAQVARIFAGHSGVQDMYPWVPLAAALLIMAVEKRRGRWYWFVSAAGVMVIQLLAGHPQFFLLSCMAVAIIVLPGAVGKVGKHWLRKLVSLVAATVVFCALVTVFSAVQLLPTAELARHSNREGGVSQEYAMTYELLPEQLWQFFAPGIMGDFFNGKYRVPDKPSSAGFSSRVLHQLDRWVIGFSHYVQFSPDVLVTYWGKGYFWETCVYVGLLPLILAPLVIFGRRPRYAGWLFMAAVLCVGGAMASTLPLYRVLYTVFPPIGLFRAPGRLLYIAYILLSVLAGLGYDALARAAGFNWKIKLRGVVVSLALAGLICWSYHAFLSGEYYSRLYTHQSTKGRATVEAQGVPFPGWQDAQFRARGSGKRMMVFFGCSLAAALLVLAGGRRSTLAYAAVLAVLTMDIFSANAHFILSIKPSDIQYPPRIAEALKGLTGKGRVVSFASWLPENMAMFYGLEHAGGNETMLIRYYTRLANLSQLRDIDEPRSVFQLYRYSNLWKLLNITHVITSRDIKLGPPGFELELETKRCALYRFTGAGPRYVLVEQAQGPLADRAAAQILGASDFNPYSKLVLAEGHGSVSEETGAAQKETGAAQQASGKSPQPLLLKWEPTEVEVVAEPVRPSYLVAMETWFPGWTVTVDGEQADLLRVNIGVRAVRLEAGRHLVKFSYRPRSFAWGLLISFGGLLVLLAVGTVKLVRRYSDRP